MRVDRSLLTEGVPIILTDRVSLLIRSREMIRVTATLKRPELRELFVEIHFAVLEEQGRHQVPSAIESLLISNGFKLTWVDPSHLHATR